MMESALNLSAAATNRGFMRKKLDYDLRQNLRRLKQAEEELGTDLTKERQILHDHLTAIRTGSSHSQTEKLDFLRVAKRAKYDSTPAYRNYYSLLSFHVHADWLAFIQALTTSGRPVKAVRVAVFACLVSADSLRDFYPHISTPESKQESFSLWQALGESKVQAVDEG